jgi:hypothetical protein
MPSAIRIVDHAPTQEASRRESLIDLFKQSPIPESELLSNLALYTSKREFSRMLYLHELYKKIVDVHGVVMEFGVRWGQNLTLFETFRGIYEPFNRIRKIVGFDTFEGFPSVSTQDGNADIISIGAYGVTQGYEEYLERLLEIHEQEGVPTTRRGFEIIKGDASIEVPEYLKRHPETIISLAYFDMDLYEPTRDCLRAIQGHLTKGSVIAFDELNYDVFPGETLALKEVMGLDKYKLVHTPYSSARSYLVVE